MFELIVKIWFLIAILPFTIATAGYKKLKVFMKNQGYELDWIYFTLAILIIILTILLIFQYGYN